jgi:hypothetical protein
MQIEEFNPCLEPIKSFVGFGKGLINSLWFAPSRELQDSATLNGMYKDWIESSPYASGVCFCELAFLLDHETEHSVSMRTAPSETALKVYQELVKAFTVRSTLFKAKEFRDGLIQNEDFSVLVSKLGRQSVAPSDGQLTEGELKQSWEKWVDAFKSIPDLMLSSAGARLNTLIAIPILVTSNSASSAKTFAGGVFAGVDETFDEPSKLSAFVQYVLLQSLWVCGIKASIQSNSAQKNQQFSHIIQGQTNKIYPAISKTPNVREREEAQRALRRLQFAVDLFDDRPFERSAESRPIDFELSALDASVIAIERLLSRIANGTKKLDSYFNDPDLNDAHERLRRSLNQIIIESWSNNIPAFYHYLGFVVPASVCLTRWSDNVICGAITFGLTQVLFHAAIYEVYQRMNGSKIEGADAQGDQNKAVAIELGEDYLVLKNRAFARISDFADGNDGLSLQKLEDRFIESGASQAKVGFGYSEESGCLWFFIRFSMLNALEG